MTQNTNRSMARAPRRRQKMDTLTKALLAAFVFVGLLLAFFGGRAIFNLVKSWSLTSLPGAPVASASTGQSDTSTSSGQPLQSSGPEAIAWDGKSRVNILLLGLDASDQRELTEPGPRMSDTMILVTIDPMNKTLGALSIRRDLWVNIPGYDYHKINKAHFLGQRDNLPGGGAGLAVETVEQFLGIPINYYAKVDFNTFVTLIDEIGGVKVEVKERILADWIGNGNNFWLEPGTYTLPGTYALAYARYRGSAQGDIDRGSRQMEVIMAMRDRILDFNMLPKLIAKAPTLYQQISAGVQTNMTLDQAMKLATLILQIPRDNFKTYNIDYSMCSPETISTADGVEYILRPFPDKIRELRDQVFANSSASAAVVSMNTEDSLTLAKSEAARIEVLNATGVSGLAESTGAYLTSQGLNVVNASSSSEAYTYTTIVVHNATPYALSYLSGLMQVPSSRIYNKYDPSGAADITVYLGNDWANSNPMP